MKIDCDTCVVRGDACSDCVVSFLTISVGAPVRTSPGLVLPSVDLDDDQAAAIRAFSQGGLVPPLRHVAS